MNNFNVDVRVVFATIVILISSIHLFTISITAFSWYDKHQTYREIEKRYFEIAITSDDHELIETTKKQIQYVKGAATREKNTLKDEAKMLTFLFLVSIVLYLLMVISFCFVRPNDTVIVKVENKDDDKT